MEHKKYEKIKPMGVSEVDGILNGEVLVFEKIDGANLSIWFNEENDLVIGTRNQILSEEQKAKGAFAGVIDYVMNHKGLHSLFGRLMGDYGTKNIRLYGEWLVPHTIGDYNKDAYNKFYLFDIEIDDNPMCPLTVNNLALELNIDCPHLFYVGMNPKREEIEKFAGRTTLGAKKGEGIVIKNHEFINKFNRRCYAKIVTDDFKEDNGIVFGNTHKGDNEMGIVSQYCTSSRVEKTLHKIKNDLGLEELSIDNAVLKQVGPRVYNDILDEHYRDIAKKGLIDFRRLQGLIGRRSIKIAMAIINGEELSILFTEDNENESKK